MNTTELIQAMTLEEKASLCSGLDHWHTKPIPRLNIPAIMVADGPHGLRKQAEEYENLGIGTSVPASCFPTASTLAATWNQALIHQVGIALAEECLENQVSVILGPGVNIKRSPLCGRNFEYFSEDPFLAGEIASSFIQGVQSQGVGTSLKHFAANNQEYRRLTIDALVDERTLREIYLPAFEAAVKQAQPWTVMCSYNRLNGVYSSENPRLLTEILKREWGFKGVVVSDWGAVNERVAGLRAGLELEMPSSHGFNDVKIVAAVKDGTLDEAVLDRAVERLLNLIFKGHENLRQGYVFSREAHQQLAREAAAEGIVLLKNEGGILPLQPQAKIAVLGEFARTPKFQAFGSSQINPTRVENALDELERALGRKLPFAPGYSLSSDDVDTALIEEARQAASGADVVLVFAGLTDEYEAEGYDREHMRLPASHIALIEAAAQANPNLVVVLNNGAPVEMPWAHQAQAILEAYLSGQAGGAAAADILLGKVNPSGKLAESFPLKLEDNPSYANFPQGPVTVEYRENLFVGYRYYDSAAKEVLFPFGHGLSYTSFAYSDIQVDKPEFDADEEVRVSLKVKNSGTLPGKEVVQLYVQDDSASVWRPVKELKGFEKVALAPGEEKEVIFNLGQRAFAFYNPLAQTWRVEPGRFHILVGASSRDVRLSAVVTLRGEEPHLAAGLPVELVLPQKAFAALYGRALPANQVDPAQPFNMNSTISDLPTKPLGKLVYKILMNIVEKMYPTKGNASTTHFATNQMMHKMMQEMPLRSLAVMSGSLNPVMVEGILLCANGKLLRGLARLYRGWQLVKRGNHPA